MIRVRAMQSLAGRLVSILLICLPGDTPVRADAPASSLPLGDPMVKPSEEFRSYFGAVPLSDERILIVGGWGSDRDDGAVRSAEIFDIRENRFLAATPSRFAYVEPTLLTLDDGRIFTVGFVNYADDHAPEEYSPEIYDPQKNDWALVDQIRLTRDEVVYAGKQHDGTVLLMAYDRHALERSSRADTAMFRAWVYDAASDTARSLSPPFTPRIGFSPILLPTGEVLATEGYSMTFEPEYRCEEIPAEYAIAAGEPSGDWCAGHGQWRRSRATTTELWNIKSGELERFDQTPISGRDASSSGAPDLFVQVLRNGDVLVVKRISNLELIEFGHIAKSAAVWSAKQKRWTAIADFPPGYHPGANNSLLELAPGVLLGPFGTYSLQTGEWDPHEGLGRRGVMMKLPSGSIGLLRMQELYWTEYGGTSGTRREDYVEVLNPSPVALDDGRLLVVGDIAGRSGYELFAQVWDPETDLWQSLDIGNKTQRPERQLVRTGSGDVLLTNMAGNGGVTCQRLQVRENRWSSCGAINLRPLVNEPGVKNPFSVRYRYQLGVLDDGRALMVDGPTSAYLYDEEKNRWTQSIKLNSNDVPLVSGSPIELPPLYWFSDPETGAEIEASDIVVSFRRRSPAHHRVGRQVTLWDPVARRWAYIGNELPTHNYFLPDGCTVGVADKMFHLFNPETRQIHKLPGVTIDSRGVAVLKDGTVAVVGEAMAKDEAGFLTRKISCSGIEGEKAIVTQAEVSPTKSPPATEKSVADVSDGIVDKLTDFLVRHYRIFIAIAVPLVLFFVIRGIIRKLDAHDVELPSMPNFSWGVRLVFYGVVGFLFGPMLISQLLRLATTADDAYAEVESGEASYWFEDHRELGELRDQLSIPCYFVGVWQASDVSPDSSSHFRYTFHDDGTLEIHTREGRTARELVRVGHWAVSGWNMVWFDEQRKDALVENFIVLQTSGAFTIRQPDGQYTRAKRVASYHRRQCIRERR